MEDVYAIWRAITRARAVGRGRGFATSRAGSRGGGDARAEVARRFAHVPHGTAGNVADAGHMLHHDQPDAVARG